MFVYRLIYEDAYEVSTLYNSVITSDGLCYAALDKERIAELFFAETDTVKKLNLGFGADGAVLGFISAAHIIGSGEAYLTFIAVDAAHRNKGIGGTLLTKLYERLKELYPDIKRIRIVYNNPVKLDCVVPGTGGALHNALGVVLGAPAYSFLKKAGFTDTIPVYAYYMPLGGFNWSDRVVEVLETLKARDIEICFYDGYKHFGFDKLCDDLGIDRFSESIFTNLEKERPDQILVVHEQGKICGFAGPISVQDSGRGYFTGFGVHSQYRGLGAGTALFAALCMCLKEMGAVYLTLFAKASRPCAEPLRASGCELLAHASAQEDDIRRIYEATGLSIVKTWANMSKEI